MPYSLCDLVDIPTIQRMMENLWKAAGLPVGIIDIDGSVLVAAGFLGISQQALSKSIKKSAR